MFVHHWTWSNAYIILSLFMFTISLGQLLYSSLRSISNLLIFDDIEIFHASVFLIHHMHASLPATTMLTTPLFQCFETSHLLHQKLNGTESQRTPKRVAIELLDTQVFSGFVQWVLLEISWFSWNFQRLLDAPFKSQMPLPNEPQSAWIHAKTLEKQHEPREITQVGWLL